MRMLSILKRTESALCWCLLFRVDEGKRTTIVGCLLGVGLLDP